jgi:nucleoside phosphorylase
LKKEIKFLTHASGSAVVADKAKRDEITAMHRKLASVEMEIYSLYRAASVSVQKPLFFAIKGVVDDAGASKGDKYHLYGATSSARLVVAALETLL